MSGMCLPSCAFRHAPKSSWLQGSRGPLKGAPGRSGPARCAVLHAEWGSVLAELVVWRCVGALASLPSPQGEESPSMLFSRGHEA
eukprot:12773490-Alexandrium_andersonii.AAC.1